MVIAQWLDCPVAVMFQYSLCRVVLMVYAKAAEIAARVEFQYSLCRVVLMVLRL